LATQPFLDTPALIDRLKAWFLRRWASVLVSVVVAVLLLATFHAQVLKVVDYAANSASVLGLLISVIGFVLTVYTVLETTAFVGGSPEGGYWMIILTPGDKLLEEYSPSSQEGIDEMAFLYKSARRSALNLDQQLDSLITELEIRTQ
jgi:hypothetical protein